MIVRRKQNDFLYGLLTRKYIVDDKTRRNVILVHSELLLYDLVLLFLVLLKTILKIVFYPAYLVYKNIA